MKTNIQSSEQTNGMPRVTEAKKRMDVICIPWEIGAHVAGGSKGALQLARALTERTGTQTGLYCLADSEGASGSELSREQKLEFFGRSVKTVGAAMSRIGVSARSLCFSADHALIVGIVSGLIRLAPEEEWGIIWIDAHPDINTPGTSITGNLHGMSLAALLGLNGTTGGLRAITAEEHKLWDQCLANGARSPLISTKHLVTVGLRVLDPGEKKIFNGLTESLHITVEQVNNGDANLLARQVTSFLKMCTKLFISFDIDSIDPNEMPGTASAAPNGIHSERMCALLDALLSDDRIAMLELTEYNPRFDTQGKGFDVILSILNRLAKHFNPKC